MKKEELKELILNWIELNYGESEKENPSYDIDKLVKVIMESVK